MVDFLPMLLLAIVSLFLISIKYIFNTNNSGTATGKYCYFIAALWTILISLCISMTGYFNSLQSLNPALYSKLEKIFSIDITKTIKPPRPPLGAPWAQLKKLRIDSIYNVNGIKFDTSGTPYLLLKNNEETTIEFISQKAGIVHFTTEMQSEPRSLKIAMRRVRILSGNYLQLLIVDFSQKNFNFIIPVQEGKNIVKISSPDKITVLDSLGNKAHPELIILFGNLRLNKEE
jgi:hypothetical protein